MKRNFSIRQIPVYVRAGAIVPEAPPMQYTSQKPLDPLQFVSTVKDLLGKSAFLQGAAPR